MSTISAKPSLDETLKHFGVKGMKWGVRKERTSAEKRAIAKKVAIGTGALLVAAGTAAVVYQLKKNNVSVNDVGKLAETGKKAAESILKEQVDIIHTSRGKNKGFLFLKNGGLPDPLSTWENAFGADGKDAGGGNFFKVLGDGKIAAAFHDPDGRTDAATRKIIHNVIVPRSMTDGIENLDDVKTKIWPLLKDAYDTFYESSTIRR